MKLKLITLPLVAIAPALALSLTSCSSTPDGEGATLIAAQQGTPGGVMVETFETTATVTAIDSATRKVTLLGEDGKKKTFKAGPEVVNFNQIQVGDKLKLKATEQLLVFMATDAPPQAQGQASLVALAPVGAKPGALVADTVQVKAKVTAIDLKSRKATLQFPDGSSEKFTVRKDVDLTQRKVGEEVVIRYTEAIAIAVDKP